MMADAKFRANLTLPDGHPLVIEKPRFTRAATSHHAHIADVLTFGPLALFIDEIGIEVLFLHRVFERAFSSTHLAKAEHIGLAHQDVYLHGLAHIGRLALGTRATGNG